MSTAGHHREATTQVEAWEVHRESIGPINMWPASQQEAAREDFDAGFRAGLEAAREAVARLEGKPGAHVVHAVAAISALMGDDERSEG